MNIDQEELVLHLSSIIAAGKTGNVFQTGFQKAVENRMDLPFESQKRRFLKRIHCL